MSEKTGSGAVSIRSLRLRALAPRALFYGLVAILSIAGIRSILEPEPPAAPAAARVVRAGDDAAAHAFAEAFARAYLTWDAARPEQRERLLDPYLPSSLSANDGFRPGERTAQDVFWTAVVGSRRVGGRSLVTIMVETSAGTVHLSVPVARDRRGFLYVAAHPAFVGPPATAEDVSPAFEADVGDRGLVAVVQRAIKNYLAGARGNLAADLSPDAVVSLPSRRLRVESTGDIAWAERGRRVAVDVDAEDRRQNSWTLRYELEVVKRDRWYVRSLHIDPTFQGGS